MKQIFLLLFLVSQSLLATVGDAGSVRESFQAMLKVELIKDDNSTVTILDGTKFVELKTTASTTGIGASLSAIRPADGTYVGVKYTVTKFKHKLKVVSAGTTYYTVEKVVPNGGEWGLSTDVKDYGYTTTLAPAGGYVTSVTFPTPLVLSSGSNAQLIWINQYEPNSVQYETNSNVENSTWIDETTKATAFLTAIPTKRVVFDIEYSKTNEPTLTNTVTVFLDANDNLLGAYNMRPDSNKALNGSFLIKADKTNNSYTFYFQNGNDSDDGVDGDDYYIVKVDLDTSNSKYSSMEIEEVIDGAAPVTAKPDNQSGYTLKTSGDINSTTIVLPK